MSASWQEIQRLFHASVDLPTLERAGFLAQACADPELRREVESLLAHAEDEDSDLTRCIGDLAAIAVNSEDLDEESIGQYRIVGTLGSGGMGAVLLGVRDDGNFQKQVAIKVIRKGMDTAEVLNRFRRERQILAHLEHPCIARLLDGGATASGAPYYVMEYVRGEPITTYCFRLNLSISDRLDLFRQVCTAVEYAHRNMVLHLDLKPANILVSEDGSPKLLDFGIAKILEQEPDPETQTVTGVMRPLTPEYASPEQVRGLPLSTATDVYSLGCILYELLTGESPQRVPSRDPLAVVEAVCLREATRPSLAAPQPVRSKLQGDLDNIVLKAMQKDAARRYGSAEQLSEDLRRHLAGFPVLARPDSVAYRARKFVRRNRWLVATASVAVLGVSIGAASAIHEGRRAARRFSQVRTLANRMLFEVEGKMRDVPGAVKAREALVSTALEYLDSLASEAGNDTSFQKELAGAYERVASVQGEPGSHSLGQYEQAEKSEGKAIALLDRAAASDPALRRQLAVAYYHLGRIRIAVEHPGPAEDAATRCVAILQPSVKDKLTRLALSDCYELLSDAADQAGHTQEALDRSRESLRLRRLALQESPSASETFAVAMSAGRLADAEKKHGDLTQAQQHLGEVIELLQPLAGQNAFSVRYLRNLEFANKRLGSIYADWFEPNLGNQAKGAEYFEAALGIAENLARADHASPEAAFEARSAQWLLSRTRLDADPKESVRLEEEIVRAQRQAVSASGHKKFDENWLAAFLVTLGESYARVGRTADGIRALSEACNLTRTRAGGKNAKIEDILDSATAHRVYAELFAEARQPEQAAQQYGEALEIARSAGTLPVDLDLHFAISELHRSAAAFYKGQPGKAAEACRLERAEVDSWAGWGRLGGTQNVLSESRLADAQAAVAKCGPKESSSSALSPRSVRGGATPLPELGRASR
ncbi:MAG TPA: serine/threonine-protein kinase [Bryobacteraceae bacterium]|nr:serine/threonine-protein kinase [Bryobacteraceae bacterium]